MKIKTLSRILFLMFSAIYSREKTKTFLNSLPELPSNPFGYDKDLKAQ